jgi:GNAT superfamily N-acetyltransferase
MRIEIRESCESDAGDLTEIRVKSKGYWGYAKEVLEAWRPAMLITADYIRGNLVRNIYADGELVGFYAIARGDTDLLDHLWLLPSVIGKGLGRQVMLHVLATARQEGIGALHIISDADAVGFYTRLGAIKVDDFFSPVQARVLPVLLLATV